MIKERELLREIMCYIASGVVSITSNDLGDAAETLHEIQELLAQPEQTKQEPIAYVAAPSIGFDVSRSVQGMPLVWLGKLEYGDKLYRVGKDDE